MSAVRPTAAPGSMPDSAGAQTSADRRGGGGADVADVARRSAM